MTLLDIVLRDRKRIGDLERTVCSLQDCCEGSGGGDLKFGVATEDFLAAEDREFDLSTHSFQFIGGAGSTIDLFLQDADTSTFGNIFVDTTQAYIAADDGAGESASVTTYPSEIQLNQTSGVYNFANIPVDDSAEYYLVENNGYLGKQAINPNCLRYTYVSIGSFSTPSNISTVGTGSSDLSTITQIIISDVLGVDDQTAWLDQLVDGNTVTMSKVGDPSVSATMTLLLNQNSDPDFRVYDVTVLSGTSYNFVDGDQFSICWEAPPQPFRFGVSGEDDLATETRSFDTDQYDFSISSAWLNTHTFNISPLNGSNSLSVDSGTANAHVNTSVSSSDEAVVEISTSSGFFSSTIRPDSVDPSPGANMSIQSSYNDGGGNLLSHEIQVNYDGIIITGAGAGTFSASNSTDLRIPSLPTTTVYDKLLVVDFADSEKVKLLDPSELIGDVVITADSGLTKSTPTNVQLGGTLLQTTTIDATANFNLKVTGSQTFGVSQGSFMAENTGAGAAIFATGTGANTVRVTNTSGGIGVFSSVDTSTAGVFNSLGNNTTPALQSFKGTNGGLSAVFTTSGSANLSSVETCVRVSRATTGTPANGIGVSVDFFNPATADVTGILSNRIVSKWNDATSATRTSQVDIMGVNSASDVTMLSIGSAGFMTLTPITATAASAITPAEGMMVFTSNTNGTFTSIGLWCFENGAWSKK